VTICINKNNSDIVLPQVLAQDITKKESSAKETALKIEAFYQSYRPIAHHSSVLYYCITDLQNVDPMYQYSLGWFIHLYIISIEGR
jgi:dynein heavy chain